ncbi:DUF1540 domain-containing protein [Luteococcus sp. OSA5]|uniref:DUF1540 domain-containing protein n=1 Tax=Luteococcus sp. OSA5 TaxID=3401630 RepID=UPI003B434604
MSIALPIIDSCATTACALNNGKCQAYAITVGSAAACTTFTELDARAEISAEDGRVAVCQRLECTHNQNLSCTAQSISVGEEKGNCLSYQAR